HDDPQHHHRVLVAALERRAVPFTGRTGQREGEYGEQHHHHRSGHPAHPAQLARPEHQRSGSGGCHTRHGATAGWAASEGWDTPALRTASQSRQAWMSVTRIARAPTSYNKSMILCTSVRWTIACTATQPSRCRAEMVGDSIPGVSATAASSCAVGTS